MYMQAGGNFVCVQCRAEAVLQCPGCPSGGQIYCERCAVGHIKKGGAHTLLSIDIPISSPEDAFYYNSRFQSISQMQGTLNIAEQIITEAEANLQNDLNRLWHTQIQTLQSAYSQVASDLKTYYSGLKSEVERMRSELNGCLTSISAPSEDTEAFMLKSAHLAPSIESLQQGLIEKLPRITLGPSSNPSGSEFLRLCEVWGGRQCSCTDCSRLHTTLLSIAVRTTKRAATTPGQQSSTPPSLPTSSYQETWTCGTCFQVNSTKSSVCRHCSTANSQWVCLKCHTSNHKEATACFNCHLKPGLVHYLLKMGVVMSPDRTKWKCAKCSNLVQLINIQCNYCGSTNSILADVLSRS